VKAAGRSRSKSASPCGSTSHVNTPRRTDEPEKHAPLWRPDRGGNAGRREKKRKVLDEHVRPARLEVARGNVRWHEIENDLVPRNRGRWLVSFYWSGSLELLPTKESRPLVVDHRKDRQVGVVNELSTIDWIDGPWICARVTVTDPPAWFKKGTKASFGHYDVHTVPIESVDAKRGTSAFVSEGSALSPGVEPAEPLAEVLWIDKESPAAVPTSDRAATGEKDDDRPH